MNVRVNAVERLLTEAVAAKLRTLSTHLAFAGVLIVFICLVSHFALWLLASIFKIKVRRFGWLSIHGIQLTRKDHYTVNISSIQIVPHKHSVTNPTWFTIKFINPVFKVQHRKLQNEEKSESNIDYLNKDSINSVLISAENRLKKWYNWNLIGLFDVTVYRAFIEMGQDWTFSLGQVTMVLHVKERPQYNSENCLHSLDFTITTKNGWLLTPSGRYSMNEHIIFSLWTIMDPGKGFKCTKIGVLIGRITLKLDVILKFLAESSSILGNGNRNSNARQLVRKASILFDILDPIIDHCYLHCVFVSLQKSICKSKESASISEIVWKTKDLGLRLERAQEETLTLGSKKGTKWRRLIFCALSSSLKFHHKHHKISVLSLPIMTLIIRSDMFVNMTKVSILEHLIQTSVFKVDFTISSCAIIWPLQEMKQFFDAIKPPCAENAESKAALLKIKEQESYLKGFALIPKSLDFNLLANEPHFALIFNERENPNQDDFIGYNINGKATSINYRLEIKNNISEKRFEPPRIFNVLVGTQFQFLVDGAQRKSVRFFDLDSLLLRCGSTDHNWKTLYIDGITNMLKISIKEPLFFECLQQIFHLMPAASPSKKRKGRFSQLMKKNLQSIKMECKDSQIEICALEALPEESIGVIISLRTLFIFTNLAHDICGNLNLLSAEESSESSTIYSKILLQGLNIFNISRYTTRFTKEDFLHVPRIIAGVVNTESRNSVKVSIDDVHGKYSLLKHFALFSVFQVLKSTFWNVNGTEFEHYDEEKTKLSNIIIVKVNSLRLKAELPFDKYMMLDIEKLRVRIGDMKEAKLQCKASRLYVENNARWEQFLCLTQIRMMKERKSVAKQAIVISTRSICFRVLFEFIIYKYIDSLVDMFKAVKQFRIRYHIDELPSPERSQKGPVVCPRIKIKSSIISVDFEDDPFESRLSMIFRLGLAEQQNRLARDQAFQIKACKVRQARKNLAMLRRETDAAGNDFFRMAPFAQGKSNGNEAANLFESTVFNSYMPEKVPNLSENSETTIGEAYHELLRHNSRSWINRFRTRDKNRIQKYMKIRNTEWGIESQKSSQGPDIILPLVNKPSLFSMKFSSVIIFLDKPNLPNDDLPAFLYKYGNGQPVDTEYCLLIPISIDWEMNECILTLRDYPLPLLHIPGSSELLVEPSWILKANLVLAEQFPKKEAIRFVDIKVKDSFILKVPRTVNAIKLYGASSIDINTLSPTSITWGVSSQAAISDTMTILDRFTKPPSDPSEKIGFWDKMRLILHVSNTVYFRKNGDVHFNLKGSRDPYCITREGAGFQFCWRGGVQIDIAQNETLQEFVIVRSEEFFWAIPDLLYQYKGDERSTQTAASQLNYIDQRNLYERYGDQFQKVIMKLRGGVRWGAGVLLERRLQNDERSFNLRPHWDINLRTPQYFHQSEGHDSFSGFRSDYIHCSIYIECPIRDYPRMSKLPPPHSYNTIHLSPKAFSHFFCWWHNFSGALSFPLKSGPLFPRSEVDSSQKFGSHLATIKYRLELSPLYLSHVYEYKCEDDWNEGKLSATGIKARIENFSIDLHQRDEETVTMRKKLRKKRQAQHMAIHVGQVVFDDINLRVISASFNECSPSEILEVQHFDADFRTKERLLMNTERKNPDQDSEEWFDTDDFIELESFSYFKTTNMNILPFGHSPKFVYYRKAAPPSPNQKDLYLLDFGREKSHKCLIAAESYFTLEDNSEDASAFKKELEVLASVEQFSQDAAQDLNRDGIGSFRNQFSVQDLRLKWTNFIRNAFLAYIDQATERIDFTYYMSRAAVRFIANLINEQRRRVNQRATRRMDQSKGKDMKTEEFELLDQLLDDLDNFYVKDEILQEEAEYLEGESQDLLNNRYVEYYNAYLVQVINPQIQFMSEKNDVFVAYMAGERVELRVISVHDKANIVYDDIGSLIQRQFIVTMNQAQFFSSSKEDLDEFKAEQERLLKQGNEAEGSVLSIEWPPWIRTESVLDFESTPDAFKRIVDRTSLSFKYLINSSLRLAQAKSLKSEGRSSFISNRMAINNLSVEFPKVILTADSTQYFGIFVICTDLLMFSDRVQKQRNERLEKLMLASDLSDLTGVSEMVNDLQVKLRQLEELSFVLSRQSMDKHPHVFEDRYKITVEYYESYEELFYLMQSVAAVEQRTEANTEDNTAKIKWYLEADEVIWHLLQKDRSPLINIGLRNATFHRFDNSDGSNNNTVEVEMMQGVNLLPNKIFADLVSPYFGEFSTITDALGSKMVRVYWYMLKAIGGINVIDHFELNLFPLKIQIEYEIGKKIFEYIFPNSAQSKKHLTKHTQHRNQMETRSPTPSNYCPGSPTESVRHSRPQNGHGSQNLIDRLSRRASKLSIRGSSNSPLRQSPTRAASMITTDSPTPLPRDEHALENQDIKQMMTRAGTNLALVYGKVPSVVLCMSYRGKKGKSWEDVTDFVFRMPTLEYRNKTWSYEDLVIQLKKDVIKTIVSHSGAFIRDKIRVHHHHRAPENGAASANSGERRMSLTSMESGTETMPRTEESLLRTASARVAPEHLRPESTRDPRTISGRIGNVLAKHATYVSQLARSRRGINDNEDPETSRLKKAKMLTGRGAGFW